MTAIREVRLRDRNGVEHTCNSEALDSTHQVLILVWEVIQRAGWRPTASASRGPANS
jgi:hypothetical protein